MFTIRRKVHLELYVCNLPRSSDIAELLKMFQPFGTVVSVQVSRNPETGISRGCGYVTMSSINSARNAISLYFLATLKDVGGREMRVRFSVDMNTRGRDRQFLNSAPKKNLIYESPHKLYVGNLGWIFAVGNYLLEKEIDSAMGRKAQCL
ncbi:hypothetical protein HS088_TW18G00695 [Tripterygium wilfordii]|uniref:RRM domain-containing protein n=1 Tax=Tripterygium wilfordii TaxID=458696 RepID=A0A7J7CDQ0_TRIWF|nr:hypothetical protein HS088_TW18G00695 [Tripterygium wilfordii]